MGSRRTWGERLRRRGGGIGILLEASEEVAKKKGALTMNVSIRSVIDSSAANSDWISRSLLQMTLGDITMEIFFGVIAFTSEAAAMSEQSNIVCAKTLRFAGGSSDKRDLKFSRELDPDESKSLL